MDLKEFGSMAILPELALVAAIAAAVPMIVPFAPLGHMENHANDVGVDVSSH